MGALGYLCLAAPALAQSLALSGDGVGTDNDRLVPGRYPADPVLSSAADLREPYDPAFNLDWSVALRGTFTKSSRGERFDTSLVPEVSLEQTGSRSTLTANGSAEVTRGDAGVIDVSALRLSGAAGYALDRDTTLAANGRFALTREVAGTPGLSDTIATAPQKISGGADLSVTRQFGKFNVGVTGSADRYVYGATTLTSGVAVDNADQNLWALEGGLRVGYQITPIFEVFGAAGLGREMFDKPSTTLGIKPDATTSTLTAGLTGRWNDRVEATASTGVALRRFDAASLGEVTAQTYDAKLVFRPDPTLQVTLGVATSVTPPGPDAAGTTRISYGANAEIAYRVNSWLALRALADWNRASFVGSTATERGYGLGAGGDYQFNARTALTADYNYDQSETTARGVQDAHQMTIGVKLAR